METTVIDMHQRVTLLDEGLEPSLAELNENAAALIQRVNENERQVRLLTSLIEENQHKLDNLLKMLADLRTTLYRHWGLSLAPVSEALSTTTGGVQIEAPSRTDSASSAGEERQTPAAGPTLAPASPSDNGKESYSEAKVLYDQGDFADAQEGFTSFLDAYPTSEIGHRAQFWLGKCFMNQNQFSRAINAFEVLRRDFPDSSYIAHALHNQAVGHYKIGEKNRAIALMEEVVGEYPASDAAKQAGQDLAQLRGRP